MEVLTLDNFARTQFDSCEQKYYLRIVRGLVELEPRNMAPYFGIAIHKAMEVKYRGGSQDEALKAFAEEYLKWYNQKDDDRTVETGYLIITEYFRRFKNDYLSCSDSELIEIGGLIEISPTLNYSGRIDMLGEVIDEPLQVPVDHKTTSRITSSFNVISPNNQFTGYLLIMRVLTGKPFTKFLVNWISTSIKKERREGGKRIKLREEDERVEFVRDFTTRTEEDFKEFIYGLKVTESRIRQCEESGRWPKRTHSCPSFNGCEYLPLCRDGVSEEMREALIRTFYKVSPWKAFEEGV